jgi:hypothetical protein
MYTKGGKDLIAGWKLKGLAESALATGGIEGLRRYYEARLTGSCPRVKTTLERDRRKTLEAELSSEVVDERERRRTLLGEVELSTPKPRRQPGERYATHVEGYHHEGRCVDR